MRSALAAEPGRDKAEKTEKEAVRTVRFPGQFTRIINVGENNDGPNYGSYRNMKKKQVFRPWQEIQIYGVKVFVFGWYWDYVCQCHVLEVLFWRYIVWIEDRPAPQVRDVRAFCFWSGFMSEARGEHWDNKSSRGIK